MAKPTVAVIGASNDRRKYGNKSLRAHLAQGYEAYPVNPNEAEVEGLKAYSRLSDIPIDHLDRITVYVPPHVGITLLEEIKQAKADEVWFNPGSESPELMKRAEQLGLDITMACSIVDLGRSPAEFADE